MKIKHWQGYGVVEAKKVSKTDNGGYTTLKVRVSGNHEWGIDLGCDSWRFYDVYNWLVKRFDKTMTDYMKIVSVSTNLYEVDGVDCCDYVIVYKK